MLGEIIVSTMHNNTPVKVGEKIGATRVIPLIKNGISNVDSVLNIIKETLECEPLAKID